MSAQQDYEIKAAMETLESFTIQGISVVTNNETGAEAINTLWERFFSDSIGTQLEEIKEDDNIYAVYSDYEGDHTKPYRLTIGHKVKNSSEMQNTVQNSDLHTIRVESGDYAALSASGEQPAALINTWQAVWESDMERKFSTDIEFYGPRFFEEGLNEVILYIGLKDKN